MQAKLLLEPLDFIVIGLYVVLTFIAWFLDKFSQEAFGRPVPGWQDLGWLNIGLSIYGTNISPGNDDSFSKYRLCQRNGC